MKIKNLSTRNQGLVARHPGNGGMPERAVVPAGATLTMKDSEWLKFAKSANYGIAKGVLEITQPPVSKLSKEDIRETIKEVAGVLPAASKTKEELQQLAITLGVDLDKYVKKEASE